MRRKQRIKIAQFGLVRTTYTGKRLVVDLQQIADPFPNLSYLQKPQIYTVKHILLFIACKSFCFRSFKTRPFSCAANIVRCLVVTLAMLPRLIYCRFTIIIIIIIIDLYEWLGSTSYLISNYIRHM